MKRKKWFYVILILAAIAAFSHYFLNLNKRKDLENNDLVYSDKKRDIHDVILSDQKEILTLKKEERRPSKVNKKVSVDHSGRLKEDLSKVQHYRERAQELQDIRAEQERRRESLQVGSFIKISGKKYRLRPDLQTQAFAGYNSFGELRAKVGKYFVGNFVTREGEDIKGRRSFPVVFQDARTGSLAVATGVIKLKINERTSFEDFLESTSYKVQQSFPHIKFIFIKVDDTHKLPEIQQKLLNDPRVDLAELEIISGGINTR